MKPKILQTKADHAAALSRVGNLMDAAPGSPEEAELELWTLLIENYESKHQPVPPPDPIEAIRFRMDQLGLGISAETLVQETQADYGSRSKTSSPLRDPFQTTVLSCLNSYQSA